MNEKLQEGSLETVGTSIVIPLSSFSSTTTTDLQPPVTEPDSYFPERQSVKDTKIYELEDQIVIQEQEIGGRGFVLGRKML